MSAGLLGRITGRFSRRKAAEDVSVLTQPQPRPVPRTVEHWFLLAAFVMLGVSVFWLAGQGTLLARAGTRLAEVSFRSPTLEDYVARLPGKPKIQLAEPVPLTLDEMASINTLKTLEHTFESIREFENGRSEFRLGKLKPALSATAPGSPAQLAGLQPGDELVALAGKPLASVWDLFSVLSANTSSSIDVEIRRGSAPYKTTLTTHSGRTMDISTAGFVFDLPDGVRYLGASDARRLAEDFIRNYVEAVPPDWRKTYAASLDGVMRMLAKQAGDQKARPPQDPAYLRSERILAWHHDAFVAEMERFRTETTSAMQAQAAALAAFGRAASSAAFAVLLVLFAFALHSRAAARVQARR